MTDTDQKSLLLLQTDLFADAGIVEKAVRSLAAKHAVRRCEMKPLKWDDKSWDKVLEAILNADEIITI